jgi:hypothetical protein
MNTEKKRLVALFADHFSNQWVVRDTEGNFWVVPSEANGWDRLQPFFPTEDSELEPGTLQKYAEFAILTAEGAWQ